ncbi:unnamed protein product [Rhodiola kirilowii]
MAEGSSFTSPCVPKFDGDYDHWSLIMENLLRSKEYWTVVENGYQEPKEGETLSTTQQKALDEAKLKDLKAKNYLFQAIDKSVLKTITQKDTAKLLWDSLKVKYQRNERVKRAQLQKLRRTFETLEMKPGESITNYFGRVMCTANDMRNNGANMGDVKIVEKILRTLTEDFNYVVCSIEESKDIDLLSVDELQSSLLVHEQKVRKNENEDQLLKVEQDRGYWEKSSRGRGAGRGSSNTSFRGRGRFSASKRSTIECYKCKKLGHYQSECPRWEEVNYTEFDEKEDLLLMARSDMENEGKGGAWFLDLGCSNHMTGNKEWFIKIDESFKHTVKLGNNTRMPVKGKGQVRFIVEGITQMITDVYYVP